MPEDMRMWVEVIFNISYLVVIWSLVLLMATRQDRLLPENRALAKVALWAFALLALGDTGHVGFRVIAYARGGLEANPALIGAGALSTAYTVTMFYMLMVELWRLRFKQKMGAFPIFLLFMGVVRMIVMAFPQNSWTALVAPYGWSLLRNSFLVVQGLGVLFLILRDAARTNDRAFTWIGIMIALSYAFYTPVILWAAQVPLLGMLMIPKTCAYLGVAFIAYNELYGRSTAVQGSLVQAGPHLRR